MKKTTWAAIVAAILGGAVAAYYLLQPSPEEAPMAVSAPEAITPAPMPPAAAPAPAEPAIRYPLAPAAGPVPEPGMSDGPILEALGAAIEKKWLALFLGEGLVRRVVATVDALPRHQVPAEAVPLKPVKGRFVTLGKGDGLAIAPRNSARYAAYARLARATDATKLVDVYVGFYPLFQRAYEELGHPNAYFNDRLVEALDDLLAAPEPAPPVGLVQPGGLYRFADPDLEARSAGQKIMIRMGPDNAAQVKAKLREIRREVTSRGSG